MRVLVEETHTLLRRRWESLKHQGAAMRRGKKIFFNTKPGISQITYVLYYVAVAMVTTFIF